MEMLEKEVGWVFSGTDVIGNGAFKMEWRSMKKIFKRAKAI